MKLGVVVHKGTLFMLVPIFWQKNNFWGSTLPPELSKKKSSKLQFGPLDMIEGVISHIYYPKNQIFPSRNIPKMATEI